MENEQQNVANHLEARIQLHERFSTDPNWHHWVFEHLPLTQEGHILELGAGSAKLWRSNLDRIPPHWQITLSDLSEHELAEGREHLQQESTHPFQFLLIDAQNIPLPDASIDIVIANHTLYYIPDLVSALAEIRRVLKPTGHFFAATHGKDHMRELHEQAQQFLPDYKIDELKFSLENGAAELSSYFAHVKRDDFLNDLEITEVEPLFAFIMTLDVARFFTPELMQAIRYYIEAQLSENGPIHITKSNGLFEAWS